MMTGKMERTNENEGQHLHLREMRKACRPDAGPEWQIAVTNAFDWRWKAHRCQIRCWGTPEETNEARKKRLKCNANVRCRK